MRNKFDEQLSQLNHEMIEMGALCEEVIALASRALTENDKSLAARVAPLAASAAIAVPAKSSICRSMENGLRRIQSGRMEL